jgi:type IV pilus biogenesis protein CpaD/CtpE
MHGHRDLGLLVFVSLALAGCSKASTDEAPSQPPVAASEMPLQAEMRAEKAEHERIEEERMKADEKATLLALADEVDAEAKARLADQNASPFRGKTGAQLKAAARRECRVGKCDTDVLDHIFESARPEDSESVRCVVRFEEDSWSCRTGENPALCDPPACP